MRHIAEMDRPRGFSRRSGAAGGLHRFARSAAVVVASISLALLGFLGCAHVPPDAGFPVVEELLAERLQQEPRWRRADAEEAEVAAAVHELLKEELGVEQAVQVALLENASLQAVYEDLGIAQAELVQAGLLRNPVFSVSARAPSRGPGSTNLELAVVQNFLDVLLRPARKRLAATDFERTRLEVADRVLAFAAETAAAWYEAVAAGQVAEVRGLIVEAAESSFEMAKRLHAAGNASALDVARERDLYESARLEQSRAEAERSSAREALTRQMGLSGDPPGWLAAPRLPDLPAAEVSLAELESAAVDQRLDLAAAGKEVELRAAALGITRRWRGLAVADVGASYERDPDGGTVLGPEIHVELPLFDRRKARVARMASELRQSERRLAALAVEIRSEVRELRDRQLLLRERADRYREVVIPLREEIVRLTQLNYNYMLAGVFELLETRRQEYDAYEEYVDTVRDYWVTRARLERAIGGRWPAPAPEREAMPGAGSEPAAGHEHHEGDR